MSLTTARNVGIVLLLAAAVAFIPGGGTTAGLIGAILSTLIIVSLVFFAYRFYREHRLELDGLGDRWRGLLYGAIGVVVLALASLPRLQNSSGGPITAGEIEIRSDRFQAFVRQSSIDLTRREFELIELLAGAEGRVLEREEIYQRVWGYAMARGDRSVDVFVRKLRQKLEKASPGWRYIHTHFGVGYRFAPEPAVGEGTAPEPVLPAVHAGERGAAPSEAPEHATLS